MQTSRIRWPRRSKTANWNAASPFCGSGEGMTMTLNKHQGIRAGLAWEPEIASLIRRHNNANIIVFPARFISNDEAVAMLDAYFFAQFEGGRHEHRIEKMAIPCCTAGETAK